MTRPTDKNVEPGAPAVPSQRRDDGPRSLDASLDRSLALLKELAINPNDPVRSHDEARRSTNQESTPLGVHRPELLVAPRRAESGGGSERSDSRMPVANHKRGGVLAIATGSVALISVLIGALWYFFLRGDDQVQSNPATNKEIAVSSPTPRQSSPTPSQSSNTETTREAHAQAVQVAMSECTRLAAQNMNSIYVLITPIRPLTDTPPTALPGETYETFFLATSKATLQAMRDGSHALDSWPFAFAIMDPVTLQRKDWDLVAGTTQIAHSVPNNFKTFHLGFERTGGTNRGMRWSNAYPREPGVCYWVNVRFR